jgi:hypothetical protein
MPSLWEAVSLPTIPFLGQDSELSAPLPWRAKKNSRTSPLLSNPSKSEQKNADTTFASPRKALKVEEERRSFFLLLGHH